MPWYFPWSESIKKRACRYLLQHYLGDFLKEKLTLEQLTVDLYNGKGTVSDIPLDVWALNEMIENVGVPLEIIDGFISSITVAVPWKSLLNESCQIEVNGMELTFAPKHKADLWNPSNMFDSTMSWSSMNMTTSIQLAQQCLNQGRSAGEEQAESTQMFEGLEAFAQTIESGNPYIHHIIIHSSITINIAVYQLKIDYSDLSYEEICGESNLPHNVYEPVAVAIKNFQIIGIRLYLDEFLFEKRTKLKETTDERNSYDDDDAYLNATDGLGRLLVDNHTRDGSNLMSQVQILGSHGKQSIKLKFKQNDSLAGPKIDVEYFFGAINIFLTPRQVHLLTDVISAVSISTPSSPSEARDNQRKLAMRTMNTDGHRRPDQPDSVSPAHPRRTKAHPDSYQSTLDSFNSAQNRRGSNHSTDDEEFYSLSDYNSLPPLGQPPQLNVNSHGRLAGDQTAGFIKQSPERSLSNISLGGNGSSLLSTMESPPKGSLAEQANNVFKASSNQQSSNSKGSKATPVIRSPHPHSTNSGLGGLSTLDDPSDLTCITFRSSNIIIILLHQEPLNTSKLEKSSRIISSEHTLTEISEEFFKGIGTFSMQHLFGDTGQDTRNQLAAYCPHDHLRFLMSAFNSTCESRTISGSRAICADFVIGKLMVDENLFDKTRKRTSNSIQSSQTKLLHFPSDQTMSAYPSGYGSTPPPCVKIKVQKTERSRSLTVQSRATIIPRSLVNIQVSKVEIELDISFIDRIAALLNPAPLYQATNNTRLYSSFLSGPTMNRNRQNAFNQAISESPIHLDNKTDISLNCPKVKIILRFPIPDLRPTSDIDKRQWWQKSIRNETIYLHLHNLEFKMVLSQIQSNYSFEFRFKEGKGYFKDSSDKQVECLHIGCLQNDCEEMHLDWPRIVISGKPATSRSVFDDVTKDSSPDSQFNSLEESFPWMKSEPSPFSSNPAMFEKEELVMPGSVGEMSTFQELASATSSFCIECYFPELKLNLQDKESFSLIYNRLFNDLMMWQPSAPAPVETVPRSFAPPQGSIHVNLASQVGLGGSDRFSMCQSAANNTYDSDSDQDTSISSTVPDVTTQVPSQQSNIAFSIHIDQGQVALFPPMKKIESEDQVPNEEDDNRPEVGHMVIDAESLNFFIVSGYKGDPNIDYIQLYSSNATLYHSSHMQVGLDLFNMDDAFDVRNLSKTIYRSDKGVLSQSQEAMDVGSEHLSALSLAMKCKRFPNRNRTDNLVAVGLRGSTLRHFVYGAGESWLTHVMDFMSVEDNAVVGFTFPTVLTTLYLHMWGCSVDYRPKFMSLHSLLAVESFNLSSNISPGSPESVLRFIINDSAFYISDKQHETVDLAKDFISVMDMGLFELILRLSDGNDKKRPLVDLSMSNNILNIRTCSDSCSALIKLIKYYASDGDVETNQQEQDLPQDSQNVSTENLYSRSSVDENTLDSLMADAMLEDDPPAALDINEGKTFTDQHGFTSSELFSSSQSLEDFASVVRELIPDDILIIDNHFKAPRGRYDQLSAPSGYPTPSYRYTLREMSVVWQMYGGNDFKPSDEAKAGKMSGSSEKHAAHSPSKSSKYTAAQNKKLSSYFKRHDASVAEDEVSRHKGRAKGGPHRDLNILMELHMNKIRYQHEIYPDNVDKISRDVLIIYDLEIRDRLAASQINKFLYRFSSESLPLKSSANMFTLKILLTKPEDKVKNREGTLRLSVQPLRLNIDQDALFFLKAFFSEISDEQLTSFSNQPSVALPVKKERIRSSSSPGTENHTDEIKMDNDHFAMTPPPNEPASETLTQEDSGIFFRSVVFSPEVPIRLDYHGKSVNMEQGTITGLLIGLAQLNCSEIKLKCLCCRSGLLGSEKLLSYFINEWLTDIRRNQIPGILGGVGPTYSFVQLYQGIKDLFWLPIQQYKQDGRIVRGLQKGAHSFSTSTAMAMLELTNRLVQTIQVAAETAYDVVSPGPDPSDGKQIRHSSSTYRAEQPTDLREGVTNAYNVLSEGFSQTATTIIKVAMDEHEKKGVTGAVGGVLRQIPPSVMQPLILASEATSNVLGGARNQLSPHARIEASKKWKSTSK
eukprot:gene20264-22250_t